MSISSGSKLGLERIEFIMALTSLGILFAVDWMSRKQNLFDEIRKQHIVFRWILYFLFIFWILIFGIYGIEYDAAKFIYFEF